MLFTLKLCRRFYTRKKLVFCVIAFTVSSMYTLSIFYTDNNQTQEYVRFPHLYSSDKKEHFKQVFLPQSTKHGLLPNPSCSEKTNFVFIKGMKSATSTLLGIFYRFGYTRNLTFVSPLGRFLYLNWPFPMTFYDFRPSSRGYNILTDHSIYTEDVMKSIMPNDCVYISIIREPLAQVKSVFRYFKIPKATGVPENVDNPIIEYFSHVEKYELVYKTPGNKVRSNCIPDGFSMTKNLMSHCLGMPLGFPPGTKDISNDTAAINRYIQHLHSKFSLIMIAEYFYESLILLRRRMCWTFKDIVFVNSNVANYSYKYSQIPKTILDLHRNWSNADYILYEYFNRTLWELISYEDSNFQSEVDIFKLVEAKIQEYCHKLYKSFKRNEFPVNMTETVIEETKWNKRFFITSGDCWMLGPNPYETIHIVQKENDKREAVLLKEQKKRVENRTMKSFC